MREKKRSEIIQDALEFLDDEMIEEVEKMRGGYLKLDTEESQEITLNITEPKKTHYPWRKWTALAASVCLLVAGSWIFGNVIAPLDTNKADESNRGTEQASNQETVIIEDADDVGGTNNRNESCEQVEIHDGVIADLESDIYGVEIPKLEMNLKKENGLEMDMLGFFIHDGRSYIQYDFAGENADFVGEQVGTVTGLIDEWTPAEGYVEGAGTFTGKIYEVEGVVPEFMLCTVWDDGTVETYINNNGMTLGKGSDLVDDRLHLRDNFKEVSFQTDYDWNYTWDEPTQLSEEYHALFEQFLDSFAEGDFEYVEGKSYYPFGGEEGIYHLYFTTDNGVRLHFTLVGDGYVMFPWINQVCVQIDQDIYDQVVEVLQNN